MKKKISLLLLTSFRLLLGSMRLHQNFVAAADHSCNAANYIFPEGLQTPPLPPVDPALAIYIRLGSTVAPEIGKNYETPLAIRSFSLMEAAGWNCIAAYDAVKNDALRPDQRPVVEVPKTISCDGGDTTTINVHITAARAQCLMYAFAAIVPTLAPPAKEILQETLDAFSSDFTNDPPTYTGAFPAPFPMEIDPAVKDCATNISGSTEDYGMFKECVNQVAAKKYYAPSIMGSIFAQDTLLYAQKDGFNMDGTNNGQCKYNCRPYSDTTGYKPQNLFTTGDYDTTADNESKKSKKSKKSSKETRRWQPLLEDNGRGFFFRQEHVAPHIGSKGVPRVLTREEINSRKLKDPKYDLKVEANLVTERLRSLDEKRKVEIEFFDDKTNIVALTLTGLLFRYFQTFTFEKAVLVSVVYTASEYDAVILAWKEKVRHDLVRPTTVIQQSDIYETPEMITTWAGPFQDIESMNSNNFQPYIRVMPHSEFPSGSGCICQASMEATKASMKVLFSDEGGEGLNFPTTVRAGSSTVEPGVTPAKDLSLSYKSLEEVRNRCGETRLEGGMHFTAAVEKSYTLCEGFQEPFEQYILSLLNGSDDLLTNYTPGGPPGGGPPMGGPPPMN